MKSRMALAGGVAAGVLAAVSATLIAGSVTLPHTFVQNTPARASEVNANFSAVKTAVDDNAVRITAIETHITAAGNIALQTSTATTGNIIKGTTRFIHNFGIQNTFVGMNAGNFTMNGISNTACGQSALTSNTTGSDNTACGSIALFSNTAGFGNTAVGTQALQDNTTGNLNAAHGRAALLSNTVGVGNTATGDSALANNTIGNSNTASGGGALSGNTAGGFNTAFGANALLRNTTGNSNIAIGFQAGSSLTTGSDNIAIANIGVAGESNTIRIGSVQNRAFISGIRNVTTANPNAINVVIDAAGQLGTISSSRRVKDDITAMGEASSALMKLRPVTFHYKTDRDPAGRTLQYGLVAEEVAAVAPGMVARSGEGEIETVYYQFLAPMLLNEYQKQQRAIEAQAAELERQRTRIAELERQGGEIASLRQQAARMAELLGRLERAQQVATARP